MIHRDAPAHAINRRTVGRRAGVHAGGAAPADGERSVILRQVANGLAVRMAALYLCVGAGG
jgi:hypothetical protein